MTKRIITLFSFSIVFLLIIIFVVNFNFSNEYKIRIFNDTNYTVENLELKYFVGDAVKTIEKIEPKKTWKGTIDTTIIQGESSVILKYKDNEGNYHEETIVGYLEKGYSGEVKVTITKIDDTDKLKIEVK